MKKHILTTVLLSSITAGSMAVASSNGERAPWDRRVEATVLTDVTGSSQNDYELKVRARAIVKFNMVLAKGLELYAKMKATQLIYDNGDFQDWNQQKIAKIVEDLSVRYELGEAIGTTRVVLIAGKQHMQFGQAISRLPIEEDSLLYGNGGAQNKEKIGVSFLVPVEVLNVIEQVALSVYENGAGDFDVAKEKGLSVKVTARLMAGLKAQFSALTQEVAGQSENENRYSAGFVYASEDGGYEVWGQGLMFKNNPEYPTAEYGGQVGASMNLARGTVIVDYQIIENNAEELGLGYKFRVGKYLAFGPEVRQRWFTAGGDVTTIGLRAAATLTHDSSEEESRGSSK